jgi:hypothetical protein
MKGPILSAEGGPFCLQIPFFHRMVTKAQKTQGLGFLLYYFQ